MLKFSSKTLELRLFSEKDIPFLKKVYFSTREPEMKQLPHWSEAMKKDRKSVVWERVCTLV